MRVNLSNEKEALMDFLSQYLHFLLVNRKVEIVVNGTRGVGVITELYYDDQLDISHLIVTLDEKEYKIPIMNETKANFGVELVVFQTQSHTAVIEFLE